MPDGSDPRFRLRETCLGWLLIALLVLIPLLWWMAHGGHL